MGGGRRPSNRMYRVVQEIQNQMINIGDRKRQRKALRMENKKRNKSRNGRIKQSKRPKNANNKKRVKLFKRDEPDECTNLVQIQM